MNINWLPIPGLGIGRDKAEKEIPVLAKELGLKYTQAKTIDKLGIITGTYRKHKVKIDINEQEIGGVLFW